MAEEFGEDVEYDNGYDEEALRPVQCVKCDTVNSPVSDVCHDCGHALTDQAQEEIMENLEAQLEENQ